MARKAIRLKIADMERAIYEAGGCLAVAAKQLNCSRRTLYRRVADNKRLQEAVDEARAHILDLAESNVFAAVKAGDPDMSKFALRNLGRDRGWGNQIDLNVRPVKPVPPFSEWADAEGIDGFDPSTASEKLLFVDRNGVHHRGTLPTKKLH